MATTTVTDAKARKAAENYAGCYIRHQQVNMEMEARIAEIKAEYAAELKKLEEQIQKRAEELEAYAEANREELFADAKSTKIGMVQFGYKLNPPKLALKSGWNWGRALVKVKELYPDYIKVKEDIDKARLKNDAGNLGKGLGKCGLQVIQEEKFAIKVA